MPAGTVATGVSEARSTTVVPPTRRRAESGEKAVKKVSLWGTLQGKAASSTTRPVLRSQRAMRAKSEVAKVTAGNDYYTPMEIASGTYAGQAVGVPTFALTATLVASSRTALVGDGGEIQQCAVTKRKCAEQPT